MITAARSRNIRFNLCIQSQQQLVYRYQEEAETIKSNCNNWIFLTSRELKLLQEISSLAGTDSNGKAIISVSALQHLDKERGQVFVFCGRLFPFVSELADIGEFDQEKYEILELEERAHISKKSVTDDTMQENSEQNITVISQKEDLDIGQRDDEVDDLQRELERKFDELFGPLDDEKYDDEKIKGDIANRTELIEEIISEEDLDDNIITLSDELGNKVHFTRLLKKLIKKLKINLIF